MRSEVEAAYRARDAEALVELLAIAKAMPPSVQPAAVHVLCKVGT